MSLSPRLAAIALLTTASLALSACGGGESTSEQQVKPAGEAVAAAETFLTTFEDGRYGEFPTGESAIETGKNIWVIDCDSARTSCSQPGTAVADAAKDVGWKVTHVDGQSDFANQSKLIDQAVVAKADAIVLVAIDCPNVKESVSSAVDAGVEVYGNFALDCDEAGDGEALFSGRTLVHGSDSFSEALQVAGQMEAAWVASRLGEDGGKVLLLDFPAIAIVHQLNLGASKGLETYCPNCEAVAVEGALADLGGGIRAKASTALAQNPDTKAIVPLFDSAIDVGVGPAATESGLDLIVTGAMGTPSAFKQIGAGGPANMTVSAPPQLQAYQAIDDLNRLFKDEDPEEPVLGWVLVDADHNLPAAGEQVTVPFDFEAMYRQRWKLS